MSIPASYLPRRDVPWGLLAFVPIVALGAAVLTVAAAPQTVLHLLPRTPAARRILRLHMPFHHHAYPRPNAPAR